MNGTVSIPKDEYFQLRLASERLARLECGGVDNWNGYSESLYGSDNEEDLDAFEERITAEITAL